MCVCVATVMIFIRLEEQVMEVPEKANKKCRESSSLRVNRREQRKKPKLKAKINQ